MWVGEGLKEEIAGERGPWRASRAAQPNIFLSSFLIVPPAELSFTHTKGVCGKASLASSRLLQESRRLSSCGLETERMIGSTNHSASFTRLSFHPHGQGPERVGRRLTAVSDGWRLSGNLKTLGYFAANVCLGVDHKTFSLIVDTGSSLAAMPCADCSGCGKHKTGARFDPSRPGATTVDCHHPPTNMRCNGCGSGNKCGYSVSYTEGSSISGQG